MQKATVIFLSFLLLAGALTGCSATADATAVTPPTTDADSIVLNEVDAISMAETNMDVQYEDVTQKIMDGDFALNLVMGGFQAAKFGKECLTAQQAANKAFQYAEILTGEDYSGQSFMVESCLVSYDGTAATQRQIWVVTVAKAPKADVRYESERVGMEIDAITGGIYDISQTTADYTMSGYEADAMMPFIQEWFSKLGLPQVVDAEYSSVRTFFVTDENGDFWYVTFAKPNGSLSPMVL